MSTTVILLGGNVVTTPRLRAQVAGARVIAADSGIRHAAELGLTPDLWVGDFDSASPELKARYAAVPRAVYPSAKDASDGDIAITEALRQGASSLILVGGFGGQFDHALSHVMQLRALVRHGAEVMISSGNEEAYLLHDELALTGLPPGARLSLVPLTDLKALSISNVRWPLSNRDVPLGATLTLSNETIGDPHMTLRSGEALVLAYPA